MIRKAKPVDQSFIAATWTKSLTSGGTAHGAKRRWANFIVDKLLDDESVRLLVAAAPENTSNLLGWVCWTQLPSTTVLHYIYVRDRVRRQGIARSLWEHAQPGFDPEMRLAYTLRGPDADVLISMDPANIIHLPIEEFIS